VQLLLDSSGNALVAALAADGGIVRECVAPHGTPLSRDIGALVAQALDGMPARELTAVGVGIGPGSFIGTRVAVSFANGLGVGAGLPVHGLPSLSAIALAAERECAVLRDARRGEAYMHVSDEPPDGVRLVPREALRTLLAECGAELVLAEAPAEDDKRGGEWRSAVDGALAEGMTLAWAGHVPARGLLALLPLCPGQEYVEPVYLRGFLQ
jgi:tRNA threonylcarbamoyl adenosine modification protein YeaZ